MTTYTLVNKLTGEIVSTYSSEKPLILMLRNIILPEEPQSLLELMVYKGDESGVVASSLYDFAVRNKVIKGRKK